MASPLEVLSDIPSTEEDLTGSLRKGLEVSLLVLPLARPGSHVASAGLSDPLYRFIRVDCAGLFNFDRDLATFTSVLEQRRVSFTWYSKPDACLTDLYPLPLRLYALASEGLSSSDWIQLLVDVFLSSSCAQSLRICSVYLVPFYAELWYSAHLRSAGLFTSLVFGKFAWSLVGHHSYDDFQSRLLSLPDASLCSGSVLDFSFRF
ncbi:hypothetical protein GQ53DRAFT_756627 [Thozetella sp. PMI_491]|nr:hypothetical protein GQ53DRAFT_756627 [Thozetella sp. PMI_491]